MSVFAASEVELFVEARHASESVTADQHVVRGAQFNGFTSRKNEPIEESARPDPTRYPVRKSR